VDELDIGVSGDTLHVELRSGADVSDATLEADVTVRALQSVGASGASSISFVDRIETGKLSGTLVGCEPSERSNRDLRRTPGAIGCFSCPAVRIGEDPRRDGEWHE
jgi:hypothetical protein